MKIASKIAAGAASFALVGLLSLPIAGAAGGDGTGPAPGAGRQFQDQKGPNNGPCYGPGQGRGHWRGYARPCNGSGGPGWHHRGYGPGAGRGGFVDKDGDGICDYHPDNGKGGETVTN